MTAIDLVPLIALGTKLKVLGQNYEVLTKTKYSIEEDANASYYKCVLSDDKALVIIPDDDLVYIGEEVPNMQFHKLSENELEYDGRNYTKTGSGHQYILEIEFGDPSKVEGKCNFEDYESGNSVISLGVLEDGSRSDILATILSSDDIEVE